MTPELLAYKDQLRMVAWPLRLGGLIAFMIGCAAMLVARYGEMPYLMTPGFVALGLGWGLMGYAVWARTQWAKANPYKGPR